MKLVRLILPFVWVFLASGLPGCGVLDNDNDETASALPIDSKILITASERLSHAGRALVLECRTEKIYPCYNYRIEHSLVRWGAVTRIAFRGVGLPGNCQTALGAARAEVDLGALDPGTYLLEFAARGKLVGAVLVVSPDAYVVTSEENPTVGFTTSRLSRIPDGTIWGLIGYLGNPGQPYDSLAGAFLDSLGARGAEARAFEPGDYGYFTIDDSGAIQSPAGHGYSFARPYIRWFDGDPAGLADVVAHVGRTHGRWLYVTLYTWRGDSYFSWVLGS